MECTNRMRLRVAALIASHLVLSTAAFGDPLNIHVQVTTENAQWSPLFESCIKRGIAVKSGDTSLVAFTPYNRSAVDVFVVTQPAVTRTGEQWGIVAAIVADVRSSNLPPEILAVTAASDRSGMA